jgi:hypothetical protein
VVDVHDETEVDDRAYRWLVRSLYTALIAANLWLAFDWWRDTDQGQAMIERCQARIAEAKVKAAECEGCARRRARLQAAMNRMHWQAERIIEGEDVPTQPEQP